MRLSSRCPLAVLGAAFARVGRALARPPVPFTDAYHDGYVLALWDAELPAEPMLSLDSHNARCSGDTSLLDDRAFFERILRDGPLAAPAALPQIATHHDA